MLFKVELTLLYSAICRGSKPSLSRNLFIFRDHYEIFRPCSTFIQNTKFNIDEHQLQQTVTRTLLRLKEGRPCSNYGSLIFLPHLVYRCNRANEFIEVADAWFSKVRPLLDQKEPSAPRRRVKIASWLIHLGKLNRQSNGTLVRKLSRTECAPNALVVMIEALIDDGLDDLSYMDVNSALTGIRDLMELSNDPNVSVRPLLQKLLASVGSFLNKDWPQNSPELGACITTLMLLKQLDFSPSESRNFQLFYRLCKLARVGLDFTTASCGKNDRQLAAGSDELELLTTFTHLWLYWRYDPDRLVRGVWSSWYAAFGAALKRRHGVPDRAAELLYLEHALSVVYFFQETRYFQEIFDDWYKSVVEIFTSNKSGIKCRDLCDLAYTISLVLGNANCVRTLPLKSVNRLKKLSSYLIDSVSSIDYAEIDSCSMGRLLNALIRIQKLGTVGRFVQFPPAKFLAYLTDWCRYVYEEKKIARSTASDQAAVFLFFLRQLNVDRLGESELFSQLLRMYVWGLWHIQDEDLTRALFYFGLTCTYYNVDPSKMKLDWIQFDIWTVWFRHCAKALSRTIGRPISKADSVHVIKLLSNCLSVADQFGRIGDFESLMALWEKAMMEQMSNIDALSAAHMSKTLTRMKERYGVHLRNEDIATNLKKNVASVLF